MPTTRPARALGALALIAAVATGCAADSGATPGETGPTRVFAADNGEITIPADPKRVVATGYAVPVLIEADAALVGIAEWSRGLEMMTGEDRATYDRLAKVAGDTTTETNYEAIAGVKPDLIVISVPKPVLADIDMKRLESIAPVVAISPSIPAAWRDLSRRQADAAGRLGSYESAKTAYEQKAAGLADKYRPVLDGLKFGHLGAYGELAKGTFQREFAGSWGTNIATDIGVDYYGQVKHKAGGSRDVGEYPSIEELPASFAEAKAITYTVENDGSVSEPVRYVLDSELWKNLPAVKAGKVFPLRYTEAATYASAQQTLDDVDKALAPLLAR
ncbi:ABC transporter substrate-binding protein [Amycolatopsis nigrescens]|uniref:ABC transporter substrate-binding protein n=1 Tax=Amycolatopsis nigrescens TaxID=381445 RepID=UPI00037D96AF|nr:ABC transporter substrate-binding protein [Amycolatopsis nigrescens]